MVPILSLAQLQSKAKTDPNYKLLAILAAENLGGSPGESLDEAMQWLNTNAQETDEEGVVEEINFCRSLV